MPLGTASQPIGAPAPEGLEYDISMIPSSRPVAEVRRPFLPQDFDEPCEGCLAPAGAYCRPGCDCGYTTEDAQAEATRASNQVRPA